ERSCACLHLVSGGFHHRLRRVGCWKRKHLLVDEWTILRILREGRSTCADDAGVLRSGLCVRSITEAFGRAGGVRKRVLIGGPACREVIERKESRCNLLIAQGDRLRLRLRVESHGLCCGNGRDGEDQQGHADYDEHYFV